jgi:hypothetical protein
VTEWGGEVFRFLYGEGRCVRVAEFSFSGREWSKKGVIWCEILGRLARRSFRFNKMLGSFGKKQFFLGVGFRVRPSGPIERIADGAARCIRWQWMDMWSFRASFSGTAITERDSET